MAFLCIYMQDKPSNYSEISAILFYTYFMHILPLLSLIWNLISFYQ